MNRHTSMFRLLYLLCLGLLLQSCITDDEDTTASINAAKTSIRVSAVSGDDEITIEASGTEWTVTEEIDWLEATKVDNSTLRVSYEENPDTEERSGTVMATISDQSVNITVTQEADKRPAFASDAIIEAQKYKQDMAIDTLTLPEAMGGDGTLTYSITPALPAGLNFDDMTRDISGIPTEVVEPAKTFTYAVEDEDGDTTNLTFTIVVEEVDTSPTFGSTSAPTYLYTSGVAITSPALPEATGGNGTISYSVRQSNMPVPNSGSILGGRLTFTPGTRLLSGTPGAAGNATYQLRATDTDGDYDELSFTLSVRSREPLVRIFLDGRSFDAQSNPINVLANSTSHNRTSIRWGNDMPWRAEVSSTGDWITSVSPATSAPGQNDSQLRVRYNTNTTFSERTGTITFSETTPNAYPPATPVVLTITQAAAVARLATTTYNIPVRSNSAVMISFSGLAFSSGIMEWWIARPDGSAATDIGGINSVSVSTGSRATTSATSFTMDVGENPNGNGANRDFPLAIHVASSVGGASEGIVPFTVSQAARTPNGAIPISNLEQLNAIRYDLNADGQVDLADPTSPTTQEMANQTAYAAAFPNLIYAANRYNGYRLTRNLDFNDADSYASGTVNTAWTTGTGWEPMGTSSTPFRDNFDGGGHTISNLFINRTSGWVGLFGYSAISGGRFKIVITNLGMLTPNITGGNDVAIGALCGAVAGGAIVTNCYVSGGTISGDESRIGGIAGELLSTAAIQASYVSGVTIRGGNGAQVGGLIGRVQGFGIIPASVLESYVTGGSQTGGTSARVGGLAGYLRGTADFCYVFKNTSTGGTSSNVGSLVGTQERNSRGASAIHVCYAGGRNYSNIRGSHTGNSVQTTVTNCYYEAAATSGAARTASDLQVPTAYNTPANNLYKNWNLNRFSQSSDKWDFGSSSEYPVLKVDFNNNSSTADDVMRQRMP